MITLATHRLTQAEVEDVVIRLLAEESGVEAQQMRAELEEAGSDLPIDSLLIVEILTRVEAECGLRLPLDSTLARSMCSVTAFSTIVADEITRRCEE